LPKLRIAVVGSGIAGLSCAWALSQRHDVILIEAQNRVGGHANTVSVNTKAGPIAVDTGFIVFNSWTYPNFTALMDYLDQPIGRTQMSFSVSADNARYEYSGHHLGTLMGSARQWFSPTHWRMMGDLLRFYRQAERHCPQVAADTTLVQYLQQFGFGDGFLQRHILPMAGAIWSASPEQIAAYPFHAFIQFFANHKLFELGKRPDWNTVTGGSSAYVHKLVEDAKFELRLSAPVLQVKRSANQVTVTYQSGETERFDHVVLATHGDAALGLLAQPTAAERAVLSAFKTSANRVYLHRDAALMPRHKRFWSGWNYRLDGTQSQARPDVTYWMNALQGLQSPDNHFVSLNPITAPAADLVDGVFDYRHPVFDTATLLAQRKLWSLQGVDRVWFCGAWFGAGFHEDGLQAGLAVAEHLGGVKRPWNVEHESGRIHLAPATAPHPDSLIEAAE